VVAEHVAEVTALGSPALVAEVAELGVVAIAAHAIAVAGKFVEVKQNETKDPAGEIAVQEKVSAQAPLFPVHPWVLSS
jgi:hypothetical protein